MQDKILESYINDFSTSYGLIEKYSDDELFEHFVNFCITSKQYPRDFDYDSVHVGGGDDIGIDGAAFIVNGNIVTTPEQITFLLDRDNYLDVVFIFIQSKRSKKFKAEQVNNFIFGVKNFFDDEPSIPENSSITELRRIKEEIYSNSIKFSENPKLNMYFATTGEWREPKSISGRVNREKNELKQKNIFRNEIDFIFYDAEKLKQTYREIQRKTSKEIQFSHHISLPEIENVRQSFIGSIPVNEYISLISDDDGNLQRNLFEDNVRDFQGDNKVNKEIKNTVKDEKIQSALPIFHNGITIISKKVDLTGNKFKLTDFQIVNGCQSSYILFELKDYLSKSTHIVIKIIETTDYDFATKVVKATNRQTEVKIEAFEALSPFQKDLEEFYKAKAKEYHDKNPIYYERRSRQYNLETSIKSSQIVNLPAQISSFVATKLAQPQSTHRYYGELLDSNRAKIFKTGDNFDQYYISALIFKKVDLLFKNKVFDKKMNIFKYHLVYILYVFYMKLVNENKNYNTENIIRDLYCKNDYIRVAKVGMSIIDNLIKNENMTCRDAARSRQFTLQLKEIIDKQIYK